MSRRQRTSQPKAHARSLPTPDQAAELSPLQMLGCVLVAVNLSGRLMFPTEDASFGSGLVFVLLGLLTGCIAVAVLFRDDQPVRIGRLDLLWLLLMVGIWVSGLTHSADFAGKLLTWEWTGIACVWFFLRFAVPQGLAQGPVVLLLVAFGLAQSLTAFWQLLVEFPHLRQLFENYDPMVLGQLEEMGIQRGSISEFQFRSRLYSNEAYGGFGHPNSLAGFLVLGIPLALSLLLSKRGHLVGRFILTICLIACVGGTLAAKSESAVVAAMFAAGGLFIASRGSQDAGTPGSESSAPNHWKFPSLAIAAIVFVGLVVVGWGTWFLAKTPVASLPGSLRSLRYRLEWWQGSLGVISESPWTGVGLGSFGNHYLRYKPEFSSEEIRDPHNFLVELAATTGLFTAAAYATLLVLTLSALGSGSRALHGADPKQSPNWMLWWMGAIAGMVTAVLTKSVGWTIVGAWLIALAFTWFARSSVSLCPQKLLSLGALFALTGIHLHWLVNGGINFPSLALATWTCAAAVTQPGGRLLSVRFPARAGLFLATAAVTFWFLINLFLPLVQREQIISQVRRTQGWHQQGRLLQEFAEKVPEDPSGWAQLAGFYTAVIQKLLPTRNRDADQTGAADSAYQQAVAAWNKAIDREPRKASYHRELAKLRLIAYQHSLDANALDEATRGFQTMLQIYPNSAVMNWELGYVLLLQQAKPQGEKELLLEAFWQLDSSPRQGMVETASALLAPAAKDDSVRQLKRALVLDQTPHIDRKLSDGQRLFARRILELQELDTQQLGADDR